MSGRPAKTAGVMGGMGPDATVDFMARVIALTSSGRDQDHIHMLVEQDPTVPNRQDAISSGVDNVSSHLAEMAQRLEACGADFLVMVCNTAHVFLNDVHTTTNIPFISIIDESVGEIGRICAGAKCVGVMATDGCLDTNIYQDAIAASGRTSVVPDEENLKKLMHWIHAVKAGDQSDEVKQGMASVADALVNDGAEVLIAGCTEIPIVFDGSDFAVPVVASTDILARRTVEFAQGLVPLPDKN